MPLPRSWRCRHTTPPRPRAAILRSPEYPQWQKTPREASPRLQRPPDWLSGRRGAATIDQSCQPRTKPSRSQVRSTAPAPHGQLRRVLAVPPPAAPTPGFRRRRCQCCFPPPSLSRSRCRHSNLLPHPMPMLPRRDRSPEPNPKPSCLAHFGPQGRRGRPRGCGRARRPHGRQPPSAASPLPMSRPSLHLPSPQATLVTTAQMPRENEQLGQQSRAGFRPGSSSHRPAPGHPATSQRPLPPLPPPPPRFQLPQHRENRGRRHSGGGACCRSRRMRQRSPPSKTRRAHLAPIFPGPHARSPHRGGRWPAASSMQTPPRSQAAPARPRLLAAPPTPTRRPQSSRPATTTPQAARPTPRGGAR
mmetsp:Transcript_153515/g.490808  ORF Transcript_153515/g.490808 Transcript_153515/m.490808 type:complete len:360 (-) Transcript_153515:203-1282(-)